MVLNWIKQFIEQYYMVLNKINSIEGYFLSVKKIE